MTKEQARQFREAIRARRIARKASQPPKGKTP